MTSRTTRSNRSVRRVRLGVVTAALSISLAFPVALAYGETTDSAQTPTDVVNTSTMPSRDNGSSPVDERGGERLLLKDQSPLQILRTAI